MQSFKNYLSTLEIVSFNLLETGVKNKIASICLNRQRKGKDEEEICMNFDFLFKSGKKWKTRLLLTNEYDKLCTESKVDEVFSFLSKKELDREIITTELRQGNIEQLQIELLGKNCEGTISTKLFSNL